jgi:hypothetical protein
MQWCRADRKPQGLRDAGDAAWLAGIGSRGTEAGNSGRPNANPAICVR